MATQQQSVTTDQALAAARKQSEQMSRQKLNAHHPELQGRLNEWIRQFLDRVTYFHPGTGERIDYPRHGMLAELMARTPTRIYDLPELKMHCDTAFVDTTARMYMSDTLFQVLEREQLAGQDSLFFVFRHEMEHLRRMHIQRMLEYPHALANIAQDIRINCDIVRLSVGDRLTNTHGRAPSTAEMDAGVDAYYNDITDTVRTFCAMQSAAEYRKWEGMSEEAIAAVLLKTWTPDPAAAPDQEVSFPLLCEGVGQDLDAMGALATATGDTAGTLAHNATAVDCRAAGKARGKLTTPQLTDLYTAVSTAMASAEMTARGMQHTAIAAAAVAAGQQGKSVSTGDPFVDTITPIERLSALKQILKMILNPSNGSGNGKGGLTVKDLDLPRSGPQKGNPGQGQGQPSQGSSTGEPSPGLYNGDDHVMSAEKLGEILKQAGVHDAAKALGYDDLDKLSQEERAAKANVSGAVNQAAEDCVRLGSVYPGGHMVDYAVAQLNEFYRPVMGWKFALKKVIEGVGNNSRYEQEEPWMQHYSSHTDMGLDSADDVGYLGSYVLGTKDRPLVFFIIDTSGSVTDAMLKRFISEAINAARDAGNGESAPEVVIVFADTIARGQPVYITQENYEEFLNKGVNYGGRGGTNFTASVQNTFRMVSAESSEDFDGEEITNSLRGRRIDAMVYFTDTFDAPPDQNVIEDTAFECGMRKLPTMLFLAPKECTNDSFKAGVKNYAEVIFFGKEELELDFEAIEAEVESQGMRRSA